jgi:putative chitobiose transport system permease protein
MTRWLGLIAIYLLLILIALVMVGPFLWLLSTSLKVGQDLFQFPPDLLPHPPSLANYLKVWQSLQIPRYILNTLELTVSGLLLNLTLASMAGYALARLRFPGRDAIFYAIVATLILPNGAGLIVNYLTIVHLHLANTLTGVVLPSAVNAVDIFIMRQAFLGIPQELEDAARVDGAGELYLWAKIMLPLVRPALATVAIFEFVGFWNIFLWPLIVLQNASRYPLAVALAYLNGQFADNFAVVAAGTVISILPVIVVFLILQRQFISGLTGALKL